MRFARQDRTGVIVEATRELSRYPDYSCPYCDGPVTLRVGYEREPHFAHRPNEGSPECEAYFPGTGGSSTNTIGRLRLEVEDAPDQAGLCLEAGRDSWTLYLRLPEIPNDELGAAPLASLQAAWVAISAGDVGVTSLYALDLRPGVGTARAYVPPTSRTYHVTPRGVWPQGVRRQRWELSANGLALAATLFRLHRGEWTRLRPYSCITWGECLYALVDHHIRPPRACVPEPMTSATAGGLTWVLWRLVLPRGPVSEVAQWFAQRGHSIAAPEWRLEMLSVPDAFDDERRLPCFPPGLPIVAKVIAPYASATSHVTLSCGSNEYRAPVRSDHEHSESFFAVTVATPGPCSLEVGTACAETAEFRCYEARDIAGLRSTLARLPRLRVWVGDRCYEPWAREEPVLTIAPQAAVLEFRIDPGIERAPLTVVFRGDDVHIVRTTLSSREAEHVIRDLLLSLQPGHLRLDAGALGAVEFQVIIAASTAQAPLEQRTVFWLACAATDRERGTAPLVSPTVIRQIATDAPLLAAAMRCPGSAAATQLRALARHRRP